MELIGEYARKRLGLICGKTVGDYLSEVKKIEAVEPSEVSIMLCKSRSPEVIRYYREQNEIEKFNKYIDSLYCIAEQIWENFDEKTKKEVNLEFPDFIIKNKETKCQN
jgi:hypothetical protein